MDLDRVEELEGFCLGWEVRVFVLVAVEDLAQVASSQEDPEWVVPDQVVQELLASWDPDLEVPDQGKVVLHEVAFLAGLHLEEACSVAHR